MTTKTQLNLIPKLGKGTECKILPIVPLQREPPTRAVIASYGSNTSVSHFTNQRPYMNRVMVPGFNSIPCTTQGSYITPEQASIIVLKYNMKQLGDINKILPDELYRRLFLEHPKTETDVSGKSTDEYKLHVIETIKDMERMMVIEMLKISRCSQNYIDKFINKTANLSNPIDDIQKYCDVSNLDNIDVVLSVPRDNFLDIILESYPNDEAIIKQAMIDIPRHNICINSNIIKNLDEMLFHLSTFNRQLFLDCTKRHNITLIMLVILLSCQSSFFLSFAHLHKKIENMMEILKNDNIPEDDPKYSISLADMGRKKEIKFYVDKDSLKISFVVYYRLFDRNTERLISGIRTETLFDLDTDVCLLTYMKTL